ncbi:hypothetical protein Q8A67_005353 [Cirrhinus molitorella]|uniref:C2H2-type domain-containing protein n=1 Tax=Cirrhinus molitorella TaxID=172907 RepID=A0AA88PZL7_9TELE|nr:hypothetical protein Q8A67_005353 [Cirrhinus molitorella]
MRFSCVLVVCVLKIMLSMKAQVDVICCKSVGTDLSMLDIEDFITEICQLKKEVASLEAKLRERGDKLNKEDVEEISVHVSDGTEAQDSIVRDQRSRDTQDSECSLNLLCHSDAEDHESTDQTFDCKAEEQEILLTPLKMCSVKLVDFRNLIESKAEETTAKEEPQSGEEDEDHNDADDQIEDEHEDQNDADDDDDFVPSDDSAGSSDGETGSTSKERRTVTDCEKKSSKRGGAMTFFFSSPKPLKKPDWSTHTMLSMKAQVDVICCKSVGTDLSMLDIEDFITEICQLKKEVASLEAKLRERGDKQYREDVKEVSVRVSDRTEAQDSVVRDQRSRDTQDSECSLNLLCHSDVEDHESTDQTSDCNAGEQQMLQIPLKMCSVKLVDCRNLIESRAEEEQSNEEEHDDDWIDDDENDSNEGTEAQDSVWSVRDQRSRDTQDSKRSIPLLCYTDAQDHESVYQTSDCKAEEQEMLLTPQKMCSVKLVDCRNLIESKVEETTAEEQQQTDEEDDDGQNMDDENQNDDDDFVPSDDSVDSSSDGETASTSKEQGTVTDCGKTFSEQGHLVRRKKKHTEQKGFTCKRCNISFPTFKEKKRHSKKHEVKKEFRCEQCKKEFFTTPYNMKVHLKTHEEKSFQCNECNKRRYDFLWSTAKTTEERKDWSIQTMLSMKAQVDVICCKSVGTDLSMLDIEDFITEICQLKKEVASLEAKLRERGDKQYREDVEEVSVRVSDGTEAQDSVVRDQRSRDTQDSECSLNLLCYSDAEDHESTDQTSDCNAGEQEMKMCFVKLVDCRNLIESRGEDTIAEEEQSNEEEQDDDWIDDDKDDENDDDSVDSSSDGETASTSKERWTVTDCGKTFSKKGHLVRRGALTIFSPPVKPLKKQRRLEHSMLNMKAQVDVICCKSVGTDLSMLDIEDFITEICQLKKEVASLEAKLRERGDKLNREKVSVRVTDGTEAQDSVWSVRDQRSRDTQDSELSLTLLCYSDPEDHESNVQTFDCKAEEQEMLLTPLKMCSVKLVDCRNLIECKEETTAEEQQQQQQQQQTNEDDEDDDGSQNMDDEDQNDDDGDFVPSDDKAGSSSDGETAPTSKEQKTKSFSCITCGKSFNKQCNLTRHARKKKHAGRKDFTCKICDIGFPTVREKKIQKSTA